MQLTPRRWPGHCSAWGPGFDLGKGGQGASLDLPPGPSRPRAWGRERTKTGAPGSPQEPSGRAERRGWTKQRDLGDPPFPWGNVTWVPSGLQSVQSVFSGTGQPLPGWSYRTPSINKGREPLLGTQVMRGEGTVYQFVPQNLLLPISSPDPHLGLNKWH